jgi:hypothetical protein
MSHGHDIIPVKTPGSETNATEDACPCCCMRARGVLRSQSMFMRSQSDSTDSPVLTEGKLPEDWSPS